MKLTPEQDRVVDRCCTMLKPVFANTAGKLIFRFTTDSHDVEVDGVFFGIRKKQKQDEEVTVVDLKD